MTTAHRRCRLRRAHRGSRNSPSSRHGRCHLKPSYRWPWLSLVPRDHRRRVCPVAAPSAPMLGMCRACRLRAACAVSRVHSHDVIGAVGFHCSRGPRRHSSLWSSMSDPQRAAHSKKVSQEKNITDRSEESARPAGRRSGDCAGTRHPPALEALQCAHEAKSRVHSRAHSSAGGRLDRETNLSRRLMVGARRVYSAQSTLQTS